MKRMVQIFLLIFIAANILIVWSHILMGIAHPEMEVPLLFIGIILPAMVLGLIAVYEL